MRTLATTCAPEEFFHVDVLWRPAEFAVNVPAGDTSNCVESLTVSTGQIVVSVKFSKFVVTVDSWVKVGGADSEPFSSPRRRSNVMQRSIAFRSSV